MKQPASNFYQQENEKTDSPRAAISAHRYLTDNPYRLLSIPSSDHVRTLRQKAAACDQALKVGLPVDVGLEGIFGRADLPDCVDQVRQITTDAEARTICRQMWPYEIHPRNRTLESLDDLDALKQSSDDTPAFFAKQIDFLTSWYAFLIDGGHDRVAMGLHAFVVLLGDEEHKRYLADLLSQEGVSPAESLQSVVKAQRELTMVLLKDASRIALQALEDGDDLMYRSILQNIEHSNLPSDFLTQAFSEVFSRYGDRAAAALSDQAARLAKTMESSNYSLDLFIAHFDLRSYTRVGQLGVMLRLRLPNAPQWLDVEQTALITVINALLPQCMPHSEHTLDELSDMENALREVGKTSIGHVTRRRIDQQMDVVTNAYRQRRFEQDFGENSLKQISAVKYTPRLFHFFGTGIKFRSAAPLPKAPICSLHTLSVTIFHVPVFPLGRYFVSSNPDGKILFRGKASLTLRQRAYVLALVALASWGYLAFTENALAHSRAAAARAPQERLAPPRSNTPPPPAPAPPNPPSLTSTPSNEALIAEGKQLAKEIDRERLALTNEKQALQSAKSALDQQDDRYQAEARKINAARKTVNRDSQDEVDAFNRSVHQANADRIDCKQKSDEWRAESAAYNAKVDASNAKLKRLKEIATKVDLTQ